MKAYIITTTIIDHDDIGADEVKVVIENTRYPNHCIAPRVESIEAVDIGDWGDGHPLNQRGVDALAWLRAKLAPPPLPVPPMLTPEHEGRVRAEFGPEAVDRYYDERARRIRAATKGGE